MKVRFLRGACVILESNGQKILTDPWLTDGEYYGSWAHIPPFESWDAIQDIDYIYVSHIHPDHFSSATMAQVPKVPVLIHQFQSPFLRRNIKNLGFPVEEIANGLAHPGLAKHGIRFSVYAADNCNPEVCQRFFGCTRAEVATTQIDSLCVIQDNEQTVVNVNDCPYELSRAMLPKLRELYPSIDLLMVAYAGAGPYPQCFDMPEAEKIVAAQHKKEKFISHVVQFAQDLGAKVVFPFAGDYVLQGKLAKLNPYRGVASLREVTEALDRSQISWIDLEPEGAKPIRRQSYIDDVLSKRLLDYETLPIPTEKELETLAWDAYAHLCRKQREYGFVSQQNLYIDLINPRMAKIPLDGKTEMTITDETPVAPFTRMTLDPRLLERIFRGPQYAHWNNAEIGSHIMFQRQPDVFERGIHQLISFLHI